MKCFKCGKLGHVNTDKIVSLTWIRGACLYIATEVMYCTLNALARSDLQNSSIHNHYGILVSHAHAERLVRLWITIVTNLHLKS